MQTTEKSKADICTNPAYHVQMIITDLGEFQLKQEGSFMPNYDVFQTLTVCFFCLNVTRPPEKCCEEREM